MLKIINDVKILSEVPCMNTRGRFNRIMNFEPCDRTIIWEFGYWAGAIKRWYKEGMPEKMEYRKIYIIQK